ncbi:hypothetical protein Hypma_008004 [Hypsizygus marmoreus]|uniref:Uncharacterized protein n=1 Tax=Hypsizygus marmoreus TaxID=39966 RepID=A0A369JUC7_HYPMA|nr:hypothetical protein Hypma_008004 [Hypsizygus marmoreus]
MSQPFDVPAYTIAAYLRIASIAVALYDYLETLPTIIRFFREQYKSRRLSLSFVLLVLIRASSILVLTISNVGFFYGKFTHATCKKFFLLPPTFKVLQVMVSQAILGVRAWNLARRSRRSSYFLVTLYFIACVLQWITTLYQRTPDLGGPVHVSARQQILTSPGSLILAIMQQGNCRAFNQARQLGAWIYYAIAVVYDFSTTAVAVFYLLKYKMASNNSLMSKVTRMMLYDGIGYFIALAGVNVFNLILYKKGQDIQTAAASLAYCVSWIMSQRLLMHLYGVSRQRRDESIEEAITITQNLDSARIVSRAIRTQFEQKSGPLDLTIPDFDLGTDPGQAEIPDENLEIQKIIHAVRDIVGKLIRGGHNGSQTQCTPYSAVHPTLERPCSLYYLEVIQPKIAAS